MTAYTTQYSRTNYKVKTIKDLVTALESTYNCKIINLGDIKRRIEKINNELNEVQKIYFKDSNVIELTQQVNKYYEELKYFGNNDIFIAKRLKVISFMDIIKDYDLVDFSQYKKDEYFIITERTKITELMYFITRLQFSTDYGHFTIHLGV